MSRVYPLHVISERIVLYSLLNISDESTQDISKYLVACLNTENYTAVSRGLLQTLIKDYPEKLTNELLVALSPPHLRQLSLEKCSGISAAGIHRVLHKCSHLQSLDLSENDKLSQPKVFEDLGKITQNLMSLSLRNCELVNDAVVHAILKHHPHLLHLDLSGNGGITDDVFLLDPETQLLASMASREPETKFLHQLSSVNISGCIGLTSAALCYLTSLCGPSLRDVHMACFTFDCTALWFLSGYSLTTAVQLTDVLETMCSDEKSIQKDISDQLLTLIEVASGVKANTPENAFKGLFQKYTLSCSSTGVKYSPAGADKTVLHENPDGPHVFVKPEAVIPGPAACMDVGPNGAALELKDVTVELTHFNQCRNSEKNEVENASVEEACAMTSSCNPACESLSDFPVSGCIREISARDRVLTFSEPSNAFLSSCPQTTKVCDLLSGAQKTSSHDILENENMQHCSRENDEDERIDMFVDMFITEVIQSSVKQLSNEIVTEQNASVKNQSNANTPMQQSTLPYVESVEGSVNCGKQDLNRQEQQKILQLKPSHQDLNQIAHQTYQPSILNLDIMYVKFHSVSLGTACLRMFAKANPGLHMFSIAWKELTDNSFEAVIESERELKTVSLVECEHLYTSSIIKLGISCQQLQNIDLKGVNFIQDPAITALVSSGNVRKLSLAESDITDVALRNIVRYGKDKLEDLDLSWCENITEDGLNEIATACSQLHSLTLRRCPATANTLKLISENCPLLTSLNLSGIGSMNEDVVISCHWVTRLDLLEQLDLSWNLWVTNDGVSTVLQSCIFLRHLSLGGNKMLTSKPYLPMISDVAKWRRSQAVLRFKIQERRFLQDHPESNTGDSSDEEYEDLFLPHRSTSYASELRYLNLEYCDMVNDIHLGELVAVCRGTLHIVGYYGEAVEPAWIAARMGSLFLAPSGIVV